MTRAAHASLLAIALLGAAGCTRRAPPPPSADAGAPSSSSAPVASAIAPAEGKAIVASACLSCHSEEMLAQQRLPKEKWAATVKKMTGWGANVESADTPALVRYLAAAYGPDAGPWVPASISATAAKGALEPADDGAYAGGDSARGKQLFVEKCSACHAQNARGDVGVNLVERPLLYRAAEVAATVRSGRGKMAALPRTTDKDIGDILAHLRTLRVR